jgi:hypothetical protein
MRRETERGAVHGRPLFARRFRVRAPSLSLERLRADRLEPMAEWTGTCGYTRARQAGHEHPDTRATHAFVRLCAANGLWLTWEDGTRAD